MRKGLGYRPLFIVHRPVGDKTNFMAQGFLLQVVTDGLVIRGNYLNFTLNRGMIG